MAKSASQKRREAKAKRKRKPSKQQGAALTETVAPFTQGGHKDEANDHAKHAANQKTAAKGRSEGKRMSGFILVVSSVAFTVFLFIVGMYWQGRDYASVRTAFYWLIPTCGAFALVALSAYWYYVVKPAKVRAPNGASALNHPTSGPTTPLSIAERPYVIVESAYIPFLGPNRPLSPVVTIINKGRTPAQRVALSLEIAAKAGFAYVLGFEDSGRRPVNIAFLGAGDRVSVGGAPADAVTIDSKFFNDAMEGKESFMIHGTGDYEDMAGGRYSVDYAFGYHPTAKGFVPDFGGPNRVEKWQDEKDKKPN